MSLTDVRLLILLFLSTKYARVMCLKHLLNDMPPHIEICAAEMNLVTILDRDSPNVKAHLKG